MEKAKPTNSYSWLGNAKNIYSQEDIVYSPFLYGIKRIGVLNISKKEEVRLIPYPSQFIFIIVKKGALHFSQGFYQIDLLENECILRDGGEVTNWTSIGSSDLECIYFIITGNNISFFYSEYERKENRKILLDDDLNRIINSLIEETKKTNLDKKNISVLLYSLLLTMLDATEDKKTTITQQAIDYIDENYQDDNLSLKELANQLHISYYYFCHLFKQENLISPQRYIAKYRLSKALLLLKNSNLSIEDIFINVGFKNKQSFIKECKRETGLLPLAYRKANHPAFIRARQTKKILFTNISNIGDPFIIVDNNKYYMFTTARNGNNINCYVSDDMKYYKYLGDVLDKTKSFGKADFWSPEVIKYKGKFYLFYSARNEKGQIHINVSVSKTINGPYRDIDLNTPLLCLDKDTTDPHVFVDVDGNPYLFFCLNCTTNIIYNEHVSQICVIKLANDLAKTIGEYKILLTPKEKWERISPNNYFRNEAPSVLYKDGTYYLTFSANNFRDVDYCSGVSTSKNVMGPYNKKVDGPIARRIDGVISSPGHLSFFYDLNGKQKCVYHILTSIKQNTSDRRACISSVYITNGQLKIDYK